MIDGQMELVSGWGRTPVTASLVSRPSSADELMKAGLDAGERGVIARGLGRAYGDAAMNAGGLVVEATGVSGVLDLDPATGLVRALAGTSLDDLMRVSVPQGWFPPVTPGTKYITIGGAIASDVHGKDHHATGSFGAHVRSMVLGLPDGTRRTLTPGDTPKEFWATCGGMGLTGTVVEATIGLHPIETSLVNADTDRVPDLDTLLALLAEGGPRHRYSVAWVDVLARGRSLGRAILTQGDFATLADVPAKRLRSRDPLAYAPPPTVTAPPGLPNGLLSLPTIRAFNELWFRKAPRRRRSELQSIDKFFYPLDMVREWNRVYGPRGFLQWQCLVPFGEEDVLRHIVEAAAEHPAPSPVSVLKYFGDADPGPLSFPAPGWTFTLDIPVRTPGLLPLLDRLDRVVADAGGRLYLAKESRMRPTLLPVMYPRLDEWRAVRDTLDPDRRLNSDLARRLDLLG